MSGLLFFCMNVTDIQSSYHIYDNFTEEIVVLTRGNSKNNGNNNNKNIEKVQDKNDKVTESALTHMDMNVVITYFIFFFACSFLF